MNVIAKCLLAASLSSFGVQESVSFTRTYKPGSEMVYSVTHNVSLVNASLSADILLTPLKAGVDGRFVVKAHMIDIQSKGAPDTPKKPEDRTIQLAGHNMPEKFVPKMGSVDFIEIWLFLAGSTLDKAVKVGDEVPWTWNGGSGENVPAMSFEGATKVLEILPAAKTFKALISGKLRIGGQDLGAVRFTSTYDLADGGLEESHGEIKITKDADKIEIKRGGVN